MDVNCGFASAGKESEGGLPNAMFSSKKVGPVGRREGGKRRVKERDGGRVRRGLEVKIHSGSFYQSTIGNETGSNRWRESNRKSGN